MSRVVILGSPFWVEQESVYGALTGWFLRTSHLTVVHGGATNGPDRFAEEWVADARNRGLKVESEIHPATKGPQAEKDRDHTMIEQGAWCELCKVEGCVLAWPLGQPDNVEYAREFGLVVINYANASLRRASGLV